MTETPHHQAAVAPVIDDLDRQVRRDFDPNADHVMRMAEVVRESLRLSPAAEDRTRTALLLIDLQNDFCYPDGALFVGGRSGTGAVDDLKRLAGWYYRHFPDITTVAASMDEHTPYQVFHTAFWQDAEGRHPAPFTQISLDDLDQERLRPSPAAVALVPADVPPAERPSWAEQQLRHYLESLGMAERYALTLWPFHCLKGSPGQNLVGAVRRMMLFHGFARCSQPVLIGKGDNPWTESYSAMGPEIATAFDGRRLEDLTSASPQNGIAHLLETHDRIVVAGQALSHCVLWTLSDMVRHVENKGGTPPEIVLLKDCCSCVTVPDGRGGFHYDSTEETDRALDHLAQRPFFRIASAEEDAKTWLTQRIAAE
ncbi:cysteine hydrolase family protein [Telmatospirillum sp. J64-1]|uniref:cysteine hydrolase family protein n=1 Tax=Telmatospirillum sp. J64-1 TaxID=2502183 RepID=UPI00115EA91D|nr:cysteine hydrolase family protein [Telmatospirillum sp. J64-1]